MSLELEKGPSYVFLVLTKKARKGCRERPALYHESPDYLSMFLDQVYERLKRLTKPPVFMYVPNFKKKTEKRCYEKKEF